MSSSDKSKNRATSELNNFQKKLEQFRIADIDLPKGPIQTDTNTQSDEMRRQITAELISLGVWDWDINANKIFYSPRWKEMLGYHSSEIGDSPNEWLERIHPGDLKSVLTLITDHLTGETDSFSSEHRILCKEQIFKWILSEGKVTARDNHGNPVRIIGINTDITQRKLTEIELQKSESLYLSVLNASPDAITIANLEGIILYSSPRILEMFGFADTSLIINRSIFEFIDKSDHYRARSNIEKLFLGTLLRAEEYTAIRSDGSLFHIEVNTEFIRDPEGNPTSIVFITRDISGRKQAEIELKKSEENYRYIFENAIEGMYRTSLDGKALMANPALVTMLGYDSTAEYLKEANDSAQRTWYNPEKRLDYISYLEKRKIIQGFECQLKRKDGTPIWVSLSAKIVQDENGKDIYLEGFVAEITDRKLAEEKIEKLNRLYSVISHVSQAIVHLRDKSELMNEVCRIAIEYGGFRMAWIGLIDEETKTVRPVAKDGVEDGYLSVIRQISVSDVQEGRGPTGTAIRKGDHFVCDNIETNPMVAPWKGEALKRGYRSSIALPLKQSGKIVGAFTLYSSQPYFFDQEEIELLDEFVNEISFAFETIETENERQKAEEQLRKLSRAVEQSPASIVIADLEGNIEYANPKASETTGYTFEELAGKNPRVLKSGETPDVEYQKLWEDITSGKEWHWIFHNKRKNGELYWESSTISPIIDHQGKITHFLAVKEDITEQKLAEEEILKFRTIADQANYGSAITSLDGQMLYINAAFAHMHGYEPNELLGKVLGVFHNEEQLPKVFGLLNQLKTTGSFSAQEVGHTRKDGSVFPTLMNASLIFDQNNIPQFMSATVIDITELKKQEEALLRSEEELNNAQELAHLGSWEHNLVTGKLTGSKNYYRMLGLQPEEKIDNLYDYFLSQVLPEDLPLIDFLQNQHHLENDMQVKDIRCVVPGVGLRWIQNNVVPVLENGRMVALRGVNMDVTEKKKIMEDLITAKEQAEESDKLKTSFLNNISHEIRTPFNGILGFLSMLQYEDLTTSERDEYIDVINQSADRLMNTINDIVDLSQIQSGLMKFKATITDIQSLVDEQVSRFRPEAENNGLIFNVSYELSGLGQNFSTDGKKLSTILYHLIGNAIKFTKSGSVDLSVRGNDRNLEFCVKDTGIGISKDKQQIIFSRFIQADHSNTRKYEGSGLGLTIAKALVEMSNGKLWLESEEGIGSSFYFNIPNNNKPLIEQTNLAEENNFPVASAKKLKILIAEDDEGSAVFLSILVKPFGKEILKARSGVEAVEICRNNPDLDLILMDIRMPVMDGYEATRQIRMFNPGVVIIAQTAFALTGDNEKSLEAGCNDYISKPIQKEKLQKVIHNFFEI